MSGAERCSWHEIVAPDGHITSTQCRNEGTHFEHIDGCGCVEPDEGICEEGWDVWVCDGLCDFPAIE